MKPIRLVVAVGDPTERVHITGALTTGSSLVVGQTGDGRAAVEISLAMRPEVAVLDRDLEGLDGCTAAIRLLSAGQTSVVFLAERAHLALARRLAAEGAASCLLKPWQPDQLQLAVTAAARLTAERKALLQRAATAERRLAERQAVERAKSLLMEQQHLSEEAAYRHLQRLSMKSRKSLGDVAHMLLLNVSLQ